METAIITNLRDPLLKDLGFEGEAFIILDFLLEDCSEDVSTRGDAGPCARFKSGKNYRWMLACENLSSWLWPEKARILRLEFVNQSIVRKINFARVDHDNWST